MPPARDRVLITGGAGFIGTHLSRRLAEEGHVVRVLDAFLPQVHGAHPRPSRELMACAELIRGDLRDPGIVRAALEGIDAVIHLAAEVGVGQSMYEIVRYTAANELGTAILMQELARKPVRRLVTASSMSIYGEGLYRTSTGRIIETARRPTTGSFDPVDAHGEPLEPLPTTERKPPDLSSVYALNKYAQERMTHIVGAAYGIETVALRLFNVYGPGQALRNPYTGVLAIFAGCLHRGRPPFLYEDGLQRRDFVHVRDVVSAFATALTAPEAAGRTLNIGSGRARTVIEIAHALAAAMDRTSLQPTVSGRRRAGDIRHRFADISAAREALGYRPRETFESSLPELVDWVASQDPGERTENADEALRERGLVA